MSFSSKSCGGQSLKTNERYLLSLTITFAFTTFAISFYTANTLDLYASVYIIEYFIVSLLHSPLNPKSQKITNLTSYALFGAFILIVSMKVLQVLGGRLF